MKGIKALQHQEVEIDALVRTKGNLQDCVSQMKERLLTADSHNTRLIGEIEEFEKKQEGIILYHSSIFETGHLAILRKHKNFGVLR